VQAQAQSRCADDIARPPRGDRRPKVIKPGPARFTLDVVATSVADVVASAGGWLFDRRSAGWDVNVLVTEAADIRPLTILGVDVIESDGDLPSGLALKSTTGLAIALDRFAIDDDVRMGVIGAVKSGATEVVMWGDGPPSGIDERFDAVVYRLSRAAEAFKSHAVAAAGLPDRQIGQIEKLYRFGLRSTCSDLTIVG
jgi:hypothetical protein